jgi:tripartite-type tricarboxylate transporter receptor subunit TctC
MKAWATALAVGAIAMGMSAGDGHAQADYPNKVVRIVVGFPAGSSVDILSRVYAQKLSERFGRQFIVESRPGAAGNVAAEAVSRAEADGYTLFVATVSNTIGASLLKNLKFSFADDFAGIALFASAPNVLVVNPSLGVSSVQELVALAKKRPGEVFYASSGNGSAPHMAGELFNLMTGAKLAHVPYKAIPPALVDLVAGRVSTVFATAPTVASFVKDGRLKALAVSTAKRSALMPDIPTMQEAGLAGFNTAIWYGFVAPKKTPPAILKQLADAVAAISLLPEVRTQLANNGADPLSLTLGDFDAFIGDEVKKWKEVVSYAKLSVD